MVKKNYRAWHIDPSKFSDSLSPREKLLFFARYAILAPSGHNTQPWRLVPRTNALDVYINRSHYLPIDGSGLTSVEPFVSLGTFLETFNLAAAGFGCKIRTDLSFQNDKVAALTLAGGRSAQPSLLTSITSRVSNRTPFNQEPIDLAKLRSWIGTEPAGVKVTMVTARPDIEFIASQTETAIGTIMSNPLYRKELSKWVRTNQTRQYDGMPGFTHGFGNLKSLVSKTAVKHAKKQGPQAKHAGELIRSSGALVIVRCTNDSQATFINAGRMYARICILANQAGYATSALGAAVLDTNTRAEVKKRFKITDRPVYVLRIGKTTVKARHAPRWPLEKLLG